MTSYDDTTPFAKGTNVLTILNDIENKASALFYWFSNNHLKTNPDRLNLLLSSKEEASLKVGDYIAKSKLLGAIIDNKLNFAEQVSKSCKQCFCTNFKHPDKQIKTYHECFLLIVVWTLPSCLLVLQSIFTKSKNQ